jgi:hypothetical protein
MKAIFWKEIKEHGKWALLWMLGIAAVMVYSLSSKHYGWVAVDSLLTWTFLAVTTFGSAAGGLLLGLLQVLMEQQRELAPFLLHRPITRSRIFVAKAASGAFLYLVAMGLPFLLCAVWVSVPGKVPGPFYWRMTLPGLADILSGLGFYFAGMLAGSRRVRWYGSRGLPIAVAASLLGIVVSVTEFRHSLLAIVPIVSLLGIAAWGAYTSLGEYAGQARISRIALGLVLLEGIGTVSLFVVAVTGTLIAGDSDRTWTSYSVDRTCRVLRVERDDYSVIRSVTDMDGDLIEEYRDVDFNDSEQAHKIFLEVDELNSGPWDWGRGYRSAGRFYQSIHSFSDTQWHYVYDRQQVEGYSLRSYGYIGTLTPDGYVAPTETSASRFEGSLLTRWWRLPEEFVPFESGVYHIDVRTRTVQPIIRAPEGEVFESFIEMYTKQSPADYTKWLILGSQNAIEIYSESGKEFIKSPYHFDRETYPSVSVGIVPSTEECIFWYKRDWKSRYAGKAGGEPLSDHIVRIAPDGREVERIDLPDIKNPQEAPALYMGLYGLLTPLLGVIVYAGVLFARPAEFHSLLDMMNRGGTPTVMVFFVSMIVSAIVFGLLAHRLARNHAFSKRVRLGWTAAAVALGPSAFLTMLSLYEWPQREPCPACGKRRVVSRDLCEHCEAAFAPPPRDGTEIFDSEPSESAGQVHEDLAPSS